MIRRFLFGASLAVSTLLTLPAAHAEEETKLLKGNFSFEGIFGTYDRASLQRGLQIYTEVCSNCHGLYEMSYRNLEGLGYNEDQVKAYASQKQVPDTNDEGQPVMRPAKGSDKFVRPFPNEKAARAANNGAYPPDLALITSAREGGADYIYSLLQGYKDAPKDVKLGNGMNYNEFFPGHQIGMPQPLTDGAVTFSDGTSNKLEQEARDIATFLQWAAEPEMEARKRMGAKVILFLLITTAALYYAKRKIWSNLH
jgi:ubiquinol-cytochrome c reductase cytochrome c1 subunit